jgi:hypothetical protein
MVKNATNPKKTVNPRTEHLNQNVPNMTLEVNIAHTLLWFDQIGKDTSGSILANRDYGSILDNSFLYLPINLMDMNFNWSIILIFGFQHTAQFITLSLDSGNFTHTYDHISHCNREL